MRFDLQPLESRCLLSSAFSSITGLLTDPTITADRKAVTADTKTLLTDQRAGRKTISADQKAVRTEYQKLITDKTQTTVTADLQPFQDQLRTDEKAKNKALLKDARSLSTTLRTWNKTILADTRAWRDAEKAGDTTTAATDKTTLDNDKTAAKAALQPIRDDIQAVKDKYRPIITADHDAITGELEKLDPALTPLYTKLDSDTTALNTKLSADETAVGDATQKLAMDIKAYQTAHSSDGTASA